MAKGVSGALTRLAKINGASPLRSDPGSSRPSSRSHPGGEEDDEVLYLTEDLEDLSARHFGRRRSEGRADRPASSETPPASGNGNGHGGVASNGPSPVYAEPPRRRTTGHAVRVESLPEEDEEAEMPPTGRSGGRIAERIRRIKTALAARAGRETEPAARASRPDKVEERAAPVRSGGGRVRASSLEDESELGRNVRGSWRPKQLARVRRRLGMTQAEFARCFGLDADDIIRWEAGARPTRAERVLLTLIMHDPEETARLVDEALPLK